MSRTAGPEILFFAGGYAPVGGVETLVSVLASGLHRAGERIGILCWGRHHELVADLEADRVPLWRQRWSWGCRWDLPDRLLFHTHTSLVRSARCIVFPKVLRPEIHRAITRTKAIDARCVLIAPYRPAELWPDGPPHSLLQQFDHIIVQARSFRDDLIRLGYEGRVSVLPLPPPAPASPPRPLPELPLKIGFLGRLVAQKNVPYLLRSFELLVCRSSAELHIFGDGDEAPALAALRDALHLSGRVFFHGRISRAAVASAIDSCHLFAFSSVMEGQCLAALEILARGRPIVATDVGAFPEILVEPEFGMLASAEAPEAYSKALWAAFQLISPSTPAKIVAKYVARYPRPSILASYRGIFAGN